ncbi:MAG: HXXEE domain-containing protein [Pseudomonadota bacterium]
MRYADLIALAVFFAMVWLPLGHQEFMAEHWMKVGTFLAPIVLFYSFREYSGTRGGVFSNVSLMAGFFAAAYFVHQFEEHWIDLLGRPYPLYNFLNEIIAGVAGPDKFGVMTPVAIFYINTGAVWATSLLAVATSRSMVFPSMAMAGLMVVNGVAHIGYAVATRGYNSGLATGVVLFLPLGVGFFLALRSEKRVGSGLIALALIWGLLGHVLLFAGIFAANVYGVIPVSVYYVGLILFGISASLLSRLKITP